MIHNQRPVMNSDVVRNRDIDVEDCRGADGKLQMPNAVFIVPRTAPAKGILPLGLLVLWLRQLVFIPHHEFRGLRREKPAPEGAGFTVPSSTHEDSSPQCSICRIELRLKCFGSGVPATLI